MPSSSLSGFGCHGNSAPSGSESTLARPDLEIRAPVFASITTSVGIPLTSNMLSSSSLRSSSCGRAFQGISPKYSLNSDSLWSELAKMISHFLPAAFIFSYDSTSFGVKLRHGGQVRREVDADGVQLLERLARCRVT